MDIISMLFQSVAQIVMSVLLLAMASGWKSTHKEFDPDDGLEIYMPLTALVLMLEFVCTALTFVDVDASHKYHDFAGLQGRGLFTVKMIMYAYFLYCIYDLKKRVRKNQTELVTSLFRLGSAYLLAIPASVVLVHAFDPCDR